MMEDKAENLYGLIGYPLGHSFSKNFFNQKFESEKISARYINFEIPDIKLLKDILETNPTLRGLNVTIPYKEQIIPFLDDLDEDAAKIGAVNVVKIIRNKNNIKLKGYNSDIIGFCDSIKPLLNGARKKALILGTGGAAKAVMRGFEKLNIEAVYVSRNKTPGCITYSEIDNRIINEYKIIVNTTPLGMYPNVDECPNIPYRMLTSDHLCYDLLYNPDETKFMKESKSYGAEVKNGLEMLLLQAFASWLIWQD